LEPFSKDDEHRQFDFRKRPRTRAEVIESVIYESEEDGTLSGEFEAERGKTYYESQQRRQF
jgi:hypothetical protein